MNLQKVADHIGGRVVGDGSLEIYDVRGIREAGKGHITYLTSSKYLDLLQQSTASAVIVEKEIPTGKAQVVFSRPALGFAKTLALFHPRKRPRVGVHERAALGNNVRLGRDVSIFPFASLGDDVTLGDGTVIYPGTVIGDRCRVGKECILYPNVTLYEDTEIGDHVILHAGVVIGADGFGYTPDENGRHFKIEQIGRVVIEDHVEIGANTCIDRANLEETLIREGTKIDNLVQIAHNCSVGKHCIIISQAGVSGSSHLGNRVIIGGQVGIVDHVNLGDNVKVMSQSGVARDIKENEIHGGSPSAPHFEYARNVALTLRLPEMTKKIKALEKKVNAIEKKFPSP